MLTCECQSLLVPSHVDIGAGVARHAQVSHRELTKEVVEAEAFGSLCDRRILFDVALAKV